jgi:hypothetical protein
MWYSEHLYMVLNMYKRGLRYHQAYVDVQLIFVEMMRMRDCQPCMRLSIKCEIHGHAHVPMSCVFGVI